MENEWFQISLKLNWFSAEFHILVCIIQNRRSDHFIYRQKELPSILIYNHKFAFKNSMDASSKNHM